MNLPPTLDPDEIAAVAELLAKAVREEREACARIAEARARAYEVHFASNSVGALFKEKAIVANSIARRIRERSEQ